MQLGTNERKVLLVLVESAGRVIGREELTRRAGLCELSTRRCDSLLVRIRRMLPEGSLRTVRKRGWVLEEAGLEAARAVLVGLDAGRSGSSRA